MGTPILSTSTATAQLGAALQVARAKGVRAAPLPTPGSERDPWESSRIGCAQRLATPASKRSHEKTIQRLYQVDVRAQAIHDLTAIFAASSWDIENEVYRALRNADLTKGYHGIENKDGRFQAVTE